MVAAEGGGRRRRQHRRRRPCSGGAGAYVGAQGGAAAGGGGPDGPPGQPPPAAAAAAAHAQGPAGRVPAGRASRFWTVLKEVAIPAPHANVCFGRPHTLRRGQVVETVAERMAVSRPHGGAAAPKRGAHADQTGQEGDERGAAAAAAALELLTAWGWVRQRCPDGGGALLAPLRDHDRADDGEVAAAEEGEEQRFSRRRRGLGWHWERALAERERPVRQPPSPATPSAARSAQPASQSGSALTDHACMRARVGIDRSPLSLR
eukprot:SAG25_NODE_1379_length_3164_cov_2.328222_4_plen_262_part_00